MADDWFRREAREKRMLANVRERLVRDRELRERRAPDPAASRFEGLTADQEVRLTRLVEAERSPGESAPVGAGSPS